MEKKQKKWWRWPLRLVLLAAVCGGLFLVDVCSRQSDAAYASLVTSSGKSEICPSFHSSILSDGLSEATRHAHRRELEPGELIGGHFVCQACGHNELIEIKSATARVFKCECADTNYFVLIVNTK